MGNGSAYTIWDIWNDCSEATWTATSPNTKPFQPATPTNLSISVVNNHPRLIWNRSAPAASAKYHVYRSLNDTLNFTVAASYLADTVYTDNSVSISGLGPKTYYYYKVRAVSGDSTKVSPGYSNTAQVKGLAPQERMTPQTGPVTWGAAEPALRTHPNPCNPFSRISVYIPENTPADLLLYDVTGRLVHRVHSGHLEAGIHQFRWDGSTYSSGVYYLILEYRGGVISDKILLIK